MIEAATNPVETAAMDIPESSNTARFRPRYSRTPTARGTTYVHDSVKQEYDSPMNRLRPEGINPFRIYLDLDCNPDISSTLDRWETSLRLALSVNRLSLEDGKRYIGMTMIKSASQFCHKIEIPLLEKRELVQRISKINEKDRCKIGWIYIGSIQMILSATFREGIDTPIDLALLDNRIVNKKKLF